MAKVLYINGGILDYGGITTWIYNYSSQLLKLSYQIEIICFGYEVGIREKDFTDLGIKVFHIPLLRDNLIENYKSLKKIMLEGKYDVVHAHIEAMNAYVLWVAKQCGIKNRISHSHGTHHYNGGTPKLLLYNFVKTRINKYATRKLSCSRQAGRWLYGNDDFLIVPNCIDYNRFQFNNDKRKDIRKQIDILQDAFVVGTIGHMSVIKNQSFLIGVLSKLLDTNDKFVLVIVGDGPERKKIENEIERNNLNDKVIILPAIKEVEKYYLMMDVFVLPSLHEGLPMTALEAQVSGLPIIISEGVPSDAIITDRAYRLPLDLDIWKDKIRDMRDLGLVRDNVVISDMFDISKCAERLNNIYFSDV